MAQGRIPQGFIDDVLNRTDIVDLIDSRVKLKKAGKNYAACCPFHNEKSPSFTVTREKQFYYCFGCGASGNAISFLMDYERLSFIDALKALSQPLGIELPDSRDENPRESLNPLYDTLTRAAQFYKDQLKRSAQRERAVSYLKQRGLTGEIARTYGLGYAPPGWDNLLRDIGQTPDARELLLKTGLLVKNESRNSVYDAMRDRIIFPIRDFRGRVIAFGGRVMGDDKPKYLNSPESPVFHKGQELYGLFEARQANPKLDQIMVVEGYMDVVALAQFGITWAVATLGTSTSTTHVERLFRLVSTVVFCFDGDNAGRRAAWRALESALPALADGKSIKFLFLPEGEDPDSLVRKEGPGKFAERMTQAEPLADFMFRHLSEEMDLGSLENRARLAAEVRPLIARVPESLFREMLIQRLSEITTLDTATLRSAIADEKGRPNQTAEPPATPAPDAWQAEQAPNTGRWPRRPVRRTPAVPATQTVSLGEKAVRLLLQEPGAASETALEELETLQMPGIPLLREIVTLLREYPDLSTAALLGALHGSEEGEELARLAAAEFLLPMDGAHLEYRDVLKRLRLASLEHQLDQLAREQAESPSMERLQEQIRLKKQIDQLRQGSV